MEKSSSGVAASRGLLHERVSLEQFDLIRVAPSAALKPFVENYWIILWDRQGEPPYVQENLPHPNQHLVIDPQGQTGVFGIQTGKFTYTLSGGGRIFGAKFWPGALRAFSTQSASSFTDRFFSIASIFDHDDTQLEHRLRQANDPVSLAAGVEAILLSGDPVLPAKSIEARQLVELVAANPDIMCTSELARLSGSSERSLQRLFETHIGASPKWVIDRYRMLEAVDALNNGGDEKLTELALRLGYFDQAHFSKAFAALTGKPPSFYLAKT